MSIKMETLLIRILYFCAALIVVFNVFEKPGIISLLFAVSFVIVVYMFIHKWIDKFKVKDIVCILTVVIALIDVLLATFNESVILNFNYFKKFIIFCVAILYFNTINDFEIDIKTKKYIIFIMYVLTFGCIVFYFVFNDVVYEYTFSGIEYLYFNFENPNFAALHFLLFAIINLSAALRNKSIRLKFINYILTGFMVFFIIETKSRNAILLVFAFIIIYIILCISKKEKRSISKTWAVVFASWPLLFSAFYMIIINFIMKGNLLQVLVSEGKGLDSRSVIWQEIFMYIAKSPVIGAYDLIYSQQAHNTHIDIWCSYGIIPLILTIYILYKVIYNNGRVYTSKFQYLYKIGFCFCIMMGMAEAALFSGGQTLYVLVGTLLIMSNWDDEKDSKVFNTSSKNLVRHEQRNL